MCFNHKFCDAKSPRKGISTTRIMEKKNLHHQSPSIPRFSYQCALTNQQTKKIANLKSLGIKSGQYAKRIHSLSSCFSVNHGLQQFLSCQCYEWPGPFPLHCKVNNIRGGVSTCMCDICNLGITHATIYTGYHGCNYIHWISQTQLYTLDIMDATIYTGYHRCNYIHWISWMQLYTLDIQCSICWLLSSFAQQCNGAGLVFDNISKMEIDFVSICITFLEAVATKVPSWLIARHARSLWCALTVTGDVVSCGPVKSRFWKYGMDIVSMVWYGHCNCMLHVL